MLLKPKNWAIFQHYKNRLPPWIKLHRDLLTDRRFMSLPIASKALAPMLWLLASEEENSIFDASLEELQFRLHISKKDYEDGIKPLIDNGFFEVASNVLAECLQRATPETERETETEKRERATIVACPPDVEQQIWEDWKQLRKAKKAPITQTVVNSARKEAQKANMSFQQFLSIWCARGSQGLQAEWLTNKADVIHQTVPSTFERDPVLVKLDEDAKQLTTMPEDVKAKFKMLKGGK